MDVAKHTIPKVTSSVQIYLIKPDKQEWRYALEDIQRPHLIHKLYY